MAECRCSTICSGGRSCQRRSDCVEPGPGTPRSPSTTQGKSLARSSSAARERAVAQAVRPATTVARARSEEHTSELQSLMRISYAVFCLKKKKKQKETTHSSLKQ